MRSPPLSLKAAALGLLAQREHSVAELRRKLLRRAAEGEVDELLAWLIANDHLSEARFAESRVHARSARFGSMRIRQELAQHGLKLNPDAAAELAASEFERARAVWQRKYPAAPSDARERAKQARFLAGRGFAAEVIRRLLRERASSGAGEGD